MDILLPVIIVAIIGLVAGLGLALAAKFMAVPVDEKEARIRECLPGANCGACGYSGCDGYATAIAAGEVSPDKCSPGGADTAKMLADILGVEVNAEPKVAFIACQGKPDTVISRYDYHGLENCTAANLVHSGPIGCVYGCIGYGDCSRVCPFGAITIQNGRPIVCEDICTGCGLCVATCPKSLISVIPKGKTTRVVCSNKNKGAAVVKVCKTSCIACGMCVKVCENDAITVENNVAVIDHSKCINCGKCKDACKRNAII